MSKVDWKNLVKIIVPMVVATAVPGAGPILAGIITHGIEVAEDSGKPGVSKLSIAKEEIDTAVAGINAVKPGTIDANQVHATVDGVINTSIQVVKQIQNVPVKK